MNANPEERGKPKPSMKSPAPKPPALVINGRLKNSINLRKDESVQSTHNAMVYVYREKTWSPVMDMFSTICFVVGSIQSRVVVLDSHRMVLEYRLLPTTKLKLKDSFVRWHDDKITLGARFTKSEAANAFHEQFISVLKQCIEYNITKNAVYLNIQLSPQNACQFKASRDMSITNLLQTICTSEKLDPVHFQLQFWDNSNPVPLDTRIAALEKRPLKLVEVKRSPHSAVKLRKTSASSYGSHGSITESIGDIEIDVTNTYWISFFDTANVQLTELANHEVQELIISFVKDRGGYSFLRKINDHKVSQKDLDDLNDLAGVVHAINNRSLSPDMSPSNSAMSTLERKKNKRKAPAPPQRLKSNETPVSPVSQSTQSLYKRKAPPVPTAKVMPLKLPIPAKRPIASSYTTTSSDQLDTENRLQRKDIVDSMENLSKSLPVFNVPLPPQDPPPREVSSPVQTPPASPVNLNNDEIASVEASKTSSPACADEGISKSSEDSDTNETDKDVSCISDEIYDEFSSIVDHELDQAMLEEELSIIEENPDSASPPVSNGFKNEVNVDSLSGTPEIAEKEEDLPEKESHLSASHTEDINVDHPLEGDETSMKDEDSMSLGANTEEKEDFKHLDGDVVEDEDSVYSKDDTRAQEQETEDTVDKEEEVPSENEDSTKESTEEEKSTSPERPFETQQVETKVGDSPASSQSASLLEDAPLSPNVYSSNNKKPPTGLYSLLKSKTAGKTTLYKTPSKVNTLATDLSKPADVKEDNIALLKKVAASDLKNNVEVASEIVLPAAINHVEKTLDSENMHVKEPAAATTPHAGENLVDAKTVEYIPVNNTKADQDCEVVKSVKEVTKQELLEDANKDVSLTNNERKDVDAAQGQNEMTAINVDYKVDEETTKVNYCPESINVADDNKSCKEAEKLNDVSVVTREHQEKTQLTLAQRRSQFLSNISDSHLNSEENTRKTDEVYNPDALVEFPHPSKKKPDPGLKTASNPWRLRTSSLNRSSLTTPASVKKAPDVKPKADTASIRSVGAGIISRDDKKKTFKDATPKPVLFPIEKQIVIDSDESNTLTVKQVPAVKPKPNKVTLPLAKTFVALPRGLGASLSLCTTHTNPKNNYISSEIDFRSQDNESSEKQEKRFPIMYSSSVDTDSNIKPSDLARLSQKMT